MLGLVLVPGTILGRCLIIKGRPVLCPVLRGPLRLLWLLLLMIGRDIGRLGRSACIIYRLGVVRVVERSC